MTPVLLALVLALPPATLSTRGASCSEADAGCGVWMPTARLERLDAAIAGCEAESAARREEARELRLAVRSASIAASLERTRAEVWREAARAPAEVERDGTGWALVVGVLAGLAGLVVGYAVASGGTVVVR